MVLGESMQNVHRYFINSTFKPCCVKHKNACNIFITLLFCQTLCTYAKSHHWYNLMGKELVLCRPVVMEGIRGQCSPNFSPQILLCPDHFLLQHI